MRCFEIPIVVSGFVFYDIVEKFSLIHGYRYDWSNHIKTSYTFVWIILFLCSQTNIVCIKAFVSTTNWYQIFHWHNKLVPKPRLKNFGRTEENRVYKMMINDILVESEVDYSFVRMWCKKMYHIEMKIDLMEFDQRWRLFKCLKFLINIDSFV